MNTPLPAVELLGRLLLALMLGAALGWDRERHRKPAGLRTHMLVTLGACAFVVSSISLGTDQPADVTRVVQGIVGGIGFLGAGSIIRSQGKVSGITTAACVWLAGALGTACGLGAYVTAVGACAFSVIVLRFLPLLERSVRKRAPPQDHRTRDSHSGSSASARGPRRDSHFGEQRE